MAEQLKQLIYNHTLRTLVKVLQGFLAGLLVMCLLTIRKVKQELSSRERAAALQVKARKVTKRRAAVL